MIWWTIRLQLKRKHFLFRSFRGSNKMVTLGVSSRVRCFDYSIGNRLSVWVSLPFVPFCLICAFNEPISQLHSHSAFKRGEAQLNALDSNCIWKWAQMNRCNANGNSLHLWRSQQPQNANWRNHICSWCEIIRFDCSLCLVIRPFSTNIASKRYEFENSIFAQKYIFIRCAPCTYYWMHVI